MSSSTGREIQIAPDTMVRGYVLADWNDNLQSYLEMEDFMITNYGGQMAYRYYKTLNLTLISTWMNDARSPAGGWPA